MLSFKPFSTVYKKGIIRSISNFGVDEAWKLATTQKSLLGSRTMILTDSNEYTKELGNRMGFEMQRNGIQPVFCTMSSPYPNHKNIEESVDLLKRTGSKSVIAIGSGAVVDTAKGIRMLAETGSRKVFTYYAAKPLQCKDVIPLVSVATSASHVHALSSYGRLHTEDDVLIKTWCRAPELTVFDSSVIEKNPYYIPEVAVSYIASQLFDILFSVSLQVLQLSATSPSVQLSPSLLESALSKIAEVSPSSYQPKVHQPYGDVSADGKSLNQIILKTAEVSDQSHLTLTSVLDQRHESSRSVSGLTAAADLVGRLQSTLQRSSPQLHCSVWPGLTEISSLLLSLNVEAELSLPYSWRAAEAFQAVTESLCDPAAVQQRNANYRRADDKMILAAVDAAFSALTSITGPAYGDLAALHQNATNAIVNRIKKTPKRFRRPSLNKAGVEYQTMTPAGHLEKIIAVDELEEADAAKAIKAATAGGREGEENRNVFDEDKEEKGKVKTPRMKLLKSDVMLDLVEKLFAK